MGPQKTLKRNADQLMLPKEILLSFKDLKVPAKNINPNYPSIKRVRVEYTKPRKDHSYYRRIALNEYKKAFLSVYGRAPFPNRFAEASILKSKRGKSGAAMSRIIDWLLDLRDERKAWNDLRQMLDDYFNCILSKFQKRAKRLPSLQITIPGEKNIQTFWLWIGDEEIFLNSSYFISKPRLDQMKKEREKEKYKRPDDPWMDRISLLANSEPIYRKNRYLMLYSPIIVIAEPLPEDIIELIAYNEGNWLYRVIVDHTGNIVEQKETER